MPESSFNFDARQLHTFPATRDFLSEQTEKISRYFYEQIEKFVYENIGRFDFPPVLVIADENEYHGDDGYFVISKYVAIVDEKETNLSLNFPLSKYPSIKITLKIHFGSYERKSSDA